MGNDDQSKADDKELGMRCPISRRDFLYLSLALAADPARGADIKAESVDLHRQLLDLADKQREQRRTRFAAVKTRDDLEALQKKPVR